MREVWFGARDHKRMTVTENLIVLYVISFFQAVIECLVYPHAFSLLIAFVGSAAVAFWLGWVVARDRRGSLWHILLFAAIFFTFVAPMRWAVFTIMGME